MLDETLLLWRKKKTKKRKTVRFFKFWAKFLLELFFASFFFFFFFVWKSPLHPLSQPPLMPHWLKNLYTKQNGKRRWERKNDRIWHWTHDKRGGRKQTSLSLCEKITRNRYRTHRILALVKYKMIKCKSLVYHRPSKTTLRKLCRSAPFPTALP